MICASIFKKCSDLLKKTSHGLLTMSSTASHSYLMTKSVSLSHRTFQWKTWLGEHLISHSLTSPLMDCMTALPLLLTGLSSLHLMSTSLLGLTHHSSGPWLESQNIISLWEWFKISCSFSFTPLLISLLKRLNSAASSTRILSLLCAMLSSIKVWFSFWLSTVKQTACHESSKL